MAKTNKQQTNISTPIVEGAASALATSSQTATPIYLTDELLDSSISAAPWSDADKREARIVGNKVIGLVAGAASNLLAAGILLNDYHAAHGDEMTATLATAIAATGIRGLSKGNIWTLRERARVFVLTFPNKAIREHLLSLTNGAEIVVRGESAEKGKPAVYQLSGFVAKAMEQVGDMPKTEGDAAEKYARKLKLISAQLRSNARTPLTPEDRATAIVEGFERFVAWLIPDEGDAKVKNPSKLLASMLRDMAKAAVQASDDVAEFDHVADALSGKSAKTAKTA